MSDYWRKILDQRVDRRRAMLATGGFAAGAAFLAACGGSDDKSSSGGGDALPATRRSPTRAAWSPSPKTRPRAPSAAARSSGPPPPSRCTSTAASGPGAAQRLQRPGLRQPGAEQARHRHPQHLLRGRRRPGRVVGVLADKLSITFKLRQGVKWHNKAPVNGRAFDSSDVVANWKRYEAKGGNRAANANSANPNAPIISVTAPDARTVVYKLKEPTSYILQRLATMTTGEAGTRCRVRPTTASTRARSRSAPAASCSTSTSRPCA